MRHDRSLSAGERFSFARPTSAAHRHIAVIGNYPPTRCGIATFTADMVSSFRGADPETQVDIYAMVRGSDPRSASVHMAIRDDDRSAHRAAGHAIDASGVGIVWLQHEFGIFGGDAGAWIIDMLTPVTAPIVVTLHTVLPDPTAAQRLVMDWLVRRAVRLVVMSEDAGRLLRDVYGTKAACVIVIPHGVPDRPFGRSAQMKQNFGLSEQKVMLTFGLLSPNKGLELVIRALPAIVARHPDAIYCIAGATHDKQIEQNGESYRDSLTTLAAELGVSEHIRWINRYLPTPELLDLIEAADVYITPYGNAVQASSGTLAYAVALGKAVISTPYNHARDMLADGVGQLVPFHDAGAIAKAATTLLADDTVRSAMQRRAYSLGRDMTWQRFGERTRDIVAAEYARPKTAGSTAIVTEVGLHRLCDGTGILQHGVFAVPDRRHGYCVDDNARAMMLAALGRGSFSAHTSVFASFVQHAWNPDSRRFRNFMSYDRRWLEDSGSEDSCGRALWAVGVVAAQAHEPLYREWACSLWDEAADSALSLGSPRALAFATLGADAMLRTHPENNVAQAICQKTLRILTAALDAHCRADWVWFEPLLAYDNCRLPEAMLKAANHGNDIVSAVRAIGALEWVVACQRAPTGHFRPVGSNGFGQPGFPIDPFDQQAVDAWATVDAAAAAFAHDGDPRWLHIAETAYAWFFGGNDRGVALVDGADGRCFDGLTPTGANRNCGAESVLSLHLAQRSVMQLRQALPANDAMATTDARAFA